MTLITKTLIVTTCNMMSVILLIVLMLSSHNECHYAICNFVIFLFRADFGPIPEKELYFSVAFPSFLNDATTSRL